MAERFGESIKNTLEGAALVEAADSGLVRNAFIDLEHAMGAEVNFSQVEMSEIGQGAFHLVDAAQGMVLPVAAVLFMKAGLEKMFGADRETR